MKTVCKYLIAFLYWPLVIFSGILAVVIFLYKITVQFSWNLADEWANEMIGKAYGLTKWIKK